MSVTCKICNKEMKKQITNTHLASHSLTVREYKEMYGDDSIMCPEFRQQLSEARTGEKNANFGKSWSHEQREAMSNKKMNCVPWNKGKQMSEEILEKTRAGIKRREEKYRTGQLQRAKPTMTDEVKTHLSSTQREYARTHKAEMSDRGKKAAQTRKEKGQDLAFFRGKKHSSHSKQLISLKSKESNKKKTLKSLERIEKNVELANCKVKQFNENTVTSECNVCGNVFTYTKQFFSESKFKLNACPVCFPREQPKRSLGEAELCSFIESLGIKVITNSRLVINAREVDIFLPELNIAIEYNGLYWHSEDVLLRTGQTKTKDNEKRQSLIKNGIRYLAIFEDEWLNKQDIVKSRLRNILTKTENIIHARKCIVRPIDSRTASKFCATNHIQDKGRSNVRYGLYFNEELVSVMTFSKSNLSRKITAWELNRFCGKLNTLVVGGASKLFSRFVKDYSPDQVISYSDNRWSQGNLYKQLNFEFSHETVPNYWYCFPNELIRYHRFALRKRSDEDPLKTEKQLRTEQGYLRIWDCGSTKWIWKRED